MCLFTKRRQMTFTAYGVSPHLVNGANCHSLSFQGSGLGWGCIEGFSPKMSTVYAGMWMPVFILPPGRLQRKDARMGDHRAHRPWATKTSVSGPETSCFRHPQEYGKFIGKGAKISASCLILAELIAICRLRKGGSLCLQLYTNWWPHQFPRISPNPMVSEMTLVTLSGS